MASRELSAEALGAVVGAVQSTHSLAANAGCPVTVSPTAKTRAAPTSIIFIMGNNSTGGTKAPSAKAKGYGYKRSSKTRKSPQPASRNEILKEGGMIGSARSDLG
jgi:hypothetical protein